MDSRSSGNYKKEILPILGKVLEALILKRLNDAIDSQFCPRQYGFRKGRSTEDAIMKLREIVESSECKYVLAIFLDIKGAFDNVWWPSVLYELKRKRCPKNIYKLIKDYLSERKVLIRDGVNEVTRKISKGCPQGSVLGPTLWNLIIDIILWAIIEKHSETIAYADDQVILIEGNSKREHEIKGQRLINEVMKWCKAQKLQLSSEKCVLMMLKANFHNKAPPTIKIEDKRIKRVEEFKYLGVVFGTGMRVGPHTEAIATRTKKMFDSLGRLARKYWGLGFVAMNTIYKGLYVPIATYASAAWYNLTTKAQKTKLIMSQRHALIKVTGVYRTTAAHSLTILTGNMPITFECQKRAEHYKIHRNIGFSVGEFMFPVKQKQN